jgi:3-oxoacyl-[acyl-carrier-protein] synthase III
MLQWKNVCLEAVSYVVPEERVTTQALEARLDPLYRALHLERGSVESLTGIRERRWWPPEPVMSSCATQAATLALAEAGLSARDLGAVVYAGVCRDNLEPATACAVAEVLGVGSGAMLYDVSNACLGVLNGLVEVANRIELGQIRSGLVVSAESSREIVESTIARLNAAPTMERYRLGLATLTGGSGACAVVLTHAQDSAAEHRLLAGATLNASAHHRLCRWGPTSGLLGETVNVMDTDATGVLEHGVELGRQTWDLLLAATGWSTRQVDRLICHQVGAGHRREVLATIGVDEERDHSTFELLGNIGTVSVPLTAAHAAQSGVLRSGDRVGLLGIGSGLNCLMLGVQW